MSKKFNKYNLAASWGEREDNQIYVFYLTQWAGSLPNIFNNHILPMSNGI